jgi:hypothetical protein
MILELCASVWNNKKVILLMHGANMKIAMHVFHFYEKLPLYLIRYKMDSIHIRQP